MTSLKRLLFCTVALIAFSSYGQSFLSNDSLLLELRKHSSRDSVRIKLLTQLAFGNYYNNPIEALKYSFEARDLSDSLNNYAGQAESYRQIGLAYWAQGDLATAVSYYLIGLRIAQENRLLQTEADLTGNIGSTYNGLGDYDEALTQLKKARLLQQQLKNEWREASVLNNLGDTYTALKKYDSAIWAYSIALKKSQEQNYLLGMATNLRNIGNVYERQGFTEKALANYLESIQLSIKIKDNRGFISSHKSLASYYLKTKKFKDAEEHATIALQTAIKSNLKPFIRDSYELLAKINDAKGDRVKGYDFFKQYVLYKDSIQNIKTISEVNAHRFRFETEKKVSEIKLLKKDAELRTTQVALRNNQLILAILLLIASSIMIFLIIRNFKKVKIKNQLLEEKNLQIENARKEISEHLDELAALNEELISQQDELYFKNTEIEKMNQRVMEVNGNLEQIVQSRTKQLELQNKQLAEYAHFNAHKLRSPVASILGLLSLLQQETSESERAILLNHLKMASENLDQVIRTINANLEEGLNVYKAS
jgi:hypothetical protein